MYIPAFNMKEDGTPDLDGMEISPAQSKWNVQGAMLRKMGKATLEGEGEWQPVTDENKAGMRFSRSRLWCRRGRARGTRAPTGMGVR